MAKVRIGIIDQWVSMDTESGSFELEIEQITFGPKHHFFGYIGQSQTIS